MKMTWYVDFHLLIINLINYYRIREHVYDIKVHIKDGKKAFSACL